MNKEIQKKWITALRSGKYIQGQNKLKKQVDNVVKHCCLGVLCELAVAEQICNETKDKENGQISRFDDQPSYLPESVMKWADVYYHTQLLLSKYNDDGRNFEEIAEYIENL